jgi:hypothetical protein
MKVVIFPELSSYLNRVFEKNISFKVQTWPAQDVSLSPNCRSDLRFNIGAHQETTEIPSWPGWMTQYGAQFSNTFNLVGRE